MTGAERAVHSQFAARHRVIWELAGETELGELAACQRGVSTPPESGPCEAGCGGGWFYGSQRASRSGRRGLRAEVSFSSPSQALSLNIQDTYFLASCDHLLAGICRCVRAAPRRDSPRSAPGLELLCSGLRCTHRSAWELPLWTRVGSAS